VSCRTESLGADFRLKFSLAEQELWKYDVRYCDMYDADETESLAHLGSSLFRKVCAKEVDGREVFAMTTIPCLP
jgi:hypothetical protein